VENLKKTATGGIVAVFLQKIEVINLLAASLIITTRVFI